MSDIRVEYAGLDSGSNTAKTAGTKTTEIQVDLSDAKTKLNDTSILMGPVQEDCTEEINELDTNITAITKAFENISSVLSQAKDTYQKGDKEAAEKILKQVIDGGSTSSSKSAKSTKGNGVSTVEIPSNINQTGYTVTCYGEGGWYLGGGSTPTAVASGTNQKLVHNAWLADGARYKNGIAVINVDGKDHYLIATAPTLGNVGDSVDVNLANGQTVPCVIADSKSTNDSNYTTYGHGRSDGSVNVLEFEVDRNKYNSSGNPTTNSWGLEWDSSSDVRSVDNYGAIV